MFRRVMAESNVGMVVIDLDGKFLAANKAMCRIIDRDEDWFRTHANLDMVHPSSSPASEALMAGMRAGVDDVEPRVMRLRKGDTGETWVRRTAVLVRDELALTPREREVVAWLAGGKTDRDIGAILGCSHRTVQKHLQRVYEKLGVETRTAAVMRALGRTPR